MLNFHELSPEKQQKFLKGVALLENGGIDAVKTWFATDFQYNLSAPEDVGAILGFCADFQNYITEHRNGNGHGTPTETAVAVAVEGDAFADLFAPPTPANADAPAEAKADPLQFVPKAMKDAPQWVLWRNKVPYQVNGQNAKANDPSTWTDYQSVVAAAIFNDTSGVGFEFANGFAGIDLDGCRDKATGEIKPWAEEIINKIDGAYVEISPSGTGIHIFVRGVVPGKDRKFNLNPAIGYGKAAVEIYDTEHYFTVTGDAYFEDAGDIVECDLTEVYAMICKLREDNPVPKSVKATSADAGEGTKIELLGAFGTTKYDIFMQGDIVSDQPFVISNRIGRLHYPSHSEADMAFATVLAMYHDCDTEKMSQDFRHSKLYRDKWDRLEQQTFAKAIATATKMKANETPIVVAPDASVPKVEYVDELTTIPPFDPSVVNGIYAKFVELATRGTTLQPQYAFAIAKAIVGARMAGRVHFENLDVEPRYYTALIGETGSGKGEAWRRILQIITAGTAEGNMAGIKVINSADSGAGIRDVFFNKPEDAPVLMYIDEVASLGNKTQGTKQPEILDRLIELADSTQISVVKAARSAKTASSKTHNNARMCAVMCGQDGNVYMSSFAGKTKLGLWDRLYPEYGEPVEAGDLPHINPVEMLQLMQEFSELNFSGKMTMSDEARDFVKAFWDVQPVGVKRKARWKKNMMLDAYMSAFGRGSRIAELEDVHIAAKIFSRQLVIRQVHFTDEVPDRTGYYLGLIKKITEGMRRKLAAGVDPYFVALTRRDYERKTNAARDNEEHIFERAWAIHSKHHLETVNIKKGNGQLYPKFIPIPEEAD